MNKTEIKNFLEDLGSEFDEVFKLLDFPLEGLSPKENLKVISNKYSELKDRVNTHSKKLQKLDRANQLNSDEQAFLLPAISEVFQHCNARKGTMDKQALSSSLDDGKYYCQYYTPEINA